ncbi:MAG TPA: hypothetical protein VLB00_03710, partial [Gemmatimonadales bacterium]|nr:hypothetical protein [Gemmatimonadales bacterium]
MADDTILSQEVQCAGNSPVPYSPFPIPRFHSYLRAMRLACTLFALAVLAPPLGAQWIIQSTGTAAEFRGLHAVNDRVVWAAGRGGVVARTTDGGGTWNADSIPGASNLFLIAIRALDQRRAWALGTAFSGASAARIYRTDDGGKTWRPQYENTTAGVFFDGMAFWNANDGIAFGDPLAGHFTLLVTRDGGTHWTPVPAERSPQAHEGEAAFAASGTAIALGGTREAWIGTGGGPRARVLYSADRGATWRAAETPAAAGPARGVFGLAFRDRRHGLAVGGDY